MNRERNLKDIQEPVAGEGGKFKKIENNPRVKFRD